MRQLHTLIFSQTKVLVYLLMKNRGTEVKGWPSFITYIYVFFLYLSNVNLAMHGVLFNIQESPKGDF